MNQKQWLLVACTAIFVVALYFGAQTKPGKIKSLEKSRVQTIEATGIENLLKEAQKNLKKPDMDYAQSILQMVEKASEDSAKVSGYKELAARWFQLGFPAISGYYAEQVAVIDSTEEAWSIAGTTYAFALKGEFSENVKQFAYRRAMTAFENALSFNPQNINHKINMALCQTDFPPKENPMQGILSLRKLNEENPNNTSILNQLGMLAIKTNQMDRAKERLEQSIAIDPNNNTTICLLADVYASIGDATKAETFKQKCSK